MFDPALDISRLDAIIKETITAIEVSKDQIYAIAEGAREEYRRLEEKMGKIQREVAAVIQKVDYLGRQEQKDRRRLVEISKDFKRYTEEDIRSAYDAAKNAGGIGPPPGAGKAAAPAADDLERNLRNLEQTAHRAEGLISQVGVVMDYLGGSLKGFSLMLKGAAAGAVGCGYYPAQEDERGRVAGNPRWPAQSLTNLVLGWSYVKNSEQWLFGDLQAELGN